MDGGDIEDNEDEPSSMLEVVEEESSQQMNSKQPDLVNSYVIIIYLYFKVAGCACIC